MRERHDVVIVGGGPAGSTAATILANSGRDVVVIEKEQFPRFHIGESLLPATVPLFDRLDVHDAIRRNFIHKPGGKWLYGPAEVPGDFRHSDSRASFKASPYSYLVERALFDEILIERSAACGADVRFRCEVNEVLIDHGRVVGVKYRDAAGQESSLYADLVIDASGLRSLIPSKFRLRQAADPQRMGIYAQYAAGAKRDDLMDGWFVGQMFYDGWTWLMRLPEDRFSVGAVLTVDRFRRSRRTPEELLERLVEENELLNGGMTTDRRRISDVYVTGNMSGSSTQLAGPGWVAVGDAAYFVDPCYSSGVHLAMKSAEMVADIVCRQPTEMPIEMDVFEGYQHEMRAHETSVQQMVDAFYIASRHTSVQKLITSLQGGHLTRRFVTFVGGDFQTNGRFIRRVHKISKFVGAVFGNNSKKRPETAPDYLFDPVFQFAAPPRSAGRKAA